jgi:hypothetical protein
LEKKNRNFSTMLQNPTKYGKWSLTRSPIKLKNSRGTTET